MEALFGDVGKILRQRGMGAYIQSRVKLTQSTSELGGRIKRSGDSLSLERTGYNSFVFSLP